jgi:phage shock protein PspC (stress-responsive transcriptional regulator)/uncharacterized membrane protein
MKKTLTVNLGGTVFNIDEDAYQLLEKYLSNLRIHFSKEEGTDEIMSDFESRISEILSERVRLGYEVITIEHVENVIKRMGKVEEIFEEDFSSDSEKQQQPDPTTSHTKERVRRRFFRNPDDRTLGGVCGGFAAYMGWDPTPIRLVLFFLMFFYAVSIPIYLILWLVVPLAKTATEKLQMRGESVTVENIGKTVTDGFDHVSSKVNDYANSDKSRSTIQRFGDGVVEILGVLLKVVLVLFGILLFPPLLIVLFVIVIVIIALVIGGLGGGFGLLYHFAPFTDWSVFSSSPEWVMVVSSISFILWVGIPVLAIIYSICSFIFKFKPLSNGLKWGLVVLWGLAFIGLIIMATQYGFPLWHINGAGNNFGLRL